jgi:hypothetical protein
MLEDYTVAVKVKLFNEVSGGLMLMSRQFEGLTEKAVVFQGHLKKIQGLMTASFGMAAGAATLASPIIYAIDKAAQLQKGMISIQIATRGTAQQMDAMRIAMEKAASPTMFSTLDVAKMGQIIATSNTLTAPQLTSLLPEYAKFADVQLLLKNTNYQTSVSEAVRLAHTAKIYDPAGLASYLDTLTKASIISSGNISELGTALKYSQGTAQTALGVSPENMVILTALANRLGFAGSRGGTNLIDAMIRTVPGIFGSGLLKGKSNEALRAMGLTDPKGHSLLFTNGKFDSMKWMEGLSSYVSKEFASHPEAIARQDILTNFQHAFGAQGRRIASLFADPKALQQFLIMEKQFEQLASNGAIQDKFVKGSVSQQYQTAVTNFQNALIELGTTLLPMTTHALNDINHALNLLIPWMRDHKQLVKDLSVALIGLAGAMAFGAIVTGLTAAFVGLSAVLRGLLAITGISSASAGLAGAGAGLAARTAAMGLTLTGVGVAGVAGYAAGSWLNQKFGLAQMIGGGLYDWAHPNAQALPGAPIVNSNTPIQITLNLDGKEVTRIVTTHQSNQMSRTMQTNTNNPDGNMNLFSVGYSGR